MSSLNQLNPLPKTLLQSEMQLPDCRCTYNMKVEDDLIIITSACSAGKWVVICVPCPPIAVSHMGAVLESGV